MEINSKKKSCEKKFKFKTKKKSTITSIFNRFATTKLVDKQEFQILIFLEEKVKYLLYEITGFDFCVNNVLYDIENTKFIFKIKNYDNPLYLYRDKIENYGIELKVESDSSVRDLIQTIISDVDSNIFGSSENMFNDLKTNQDNYINYNIIEIYVLLFKSLYFNFIKLYQDYNNNQTVPDDTKSYLHAMIKEKYKDKKETSLTTLYKLHYYLNTQDYKNLYLAMDEYANN